MNTLLTGWSADPLVLTGLAAGALLWWRIAATFHPRPSQRWYAGASLLVAAVALLSPLDAGVHRSFALHMMQHVLLMMVAPPLVALATPPTFLGWLRNRPLAGPVVRTLWSPVTAFATYHIVLFLWHLPILYTAALRYTGIHLVQHATFFVSGLALWGVIAAPDPRLVGATTGHRIVLTVAANVMNWALSFSLALAGRPLYPSYTSPSPIRNLSPLDDLHLGGVVMWVMGNMMYAVAVMLLLFAFMNAETRKHQRAAAPGA